MRAFFSLSLRLTLNYPLNFGMMIGSLFVPVLTFYFISRFLVPSGGAAGPDYFAFVVLGIVAGNLLAAGMQSFGRQIDTTVQQGQFEMLLAEPVSWTWLPLGLSVWPAAFRLFGSVAVVLVSLLLGVTYEVSGVPLALIVSGLGLVASLCLGIFSGALRVLAKEGDPLLSLYSMVAMLLGGAYFPIATLPGPLRALSLLLPNTYVNYGLRHALIPGFEGVSPSASMCLLFLVIFDIVMLPLSVRFFARCMDVGRRHGVLAGY
jgi:ABC-2 type transport system permease protein